MRFKAASSQVRHLQRDTANRVDLMELVEITIGFGAYEDVHSKASQRAFESDIKRLKDLGVDVEYVRSDNVYRLNSYKSMPGKN